MKFWAEDGTPQGFGHELFADDLERIEPNMLRAIDRVPVVGSAGIKRVINGPITRHIASTRTCSRRGIQPCHPAPVAKV